MTDQTKKDVPVLLEVCVDDVAGMQAAIRGGADRLELCSALACGGLTPSRGLMQQAGQVPIPVVAMIRPRSGSFVFSADEIRVMIDDIQAARDAGLAGVVLGASLPDGRLDCETLANLVQAATGMDITLHRVFDLVPDHQAALAQAASLGFRRILTSGGCKTALDGLSRLRHLVALSQGKISIMPGGGVSVDNLAAFAEIGVREFHASCSAPMAMAPALVDFGFETADRRVTDESRVRVMRQALSDLAARPLRKDKA